MKKIPLTKGKVALVDDADYRYLNRWRWRVIKPDKIFYAIRHSPRIQGKRTEIYMHRQILRLHPGNKKQADHINGDGLDNRRCNLRACTNRENACNQRSQSGRSSKYKGVIWDHRDGKWQVYVKFNGRKKHLGLFNDEVEAAKAYDAAAKLLFGEFAKFNFDAQTDDPQLKILSQGGNGDHS